jgi:hypothetical protein
MEGTLSPGKGPDAQSVRVIIRVRPQLLSEAAEECCAQVTPVCLKPFAPALKVYSQNFTLTATLSNAN